jgi:hypothetical protein
VKIGDLIMLESAIENNMDQLIMSGVFSVLESLKLVTLTNCVKRVAAAVAASD